MCEKLLPDDCNKRSDCFLEKNECKQVGKEEPVLQQTCDKLLPDDCNKRTDCVLEKNECKEAETGTCKSLFTESRLEIIPAPTTDTTRFCFRDLLLVSI